MSQEEKIDLLIKKVDNLQLTLNWMIKGMNNAQSLRGEPLTMELVKKHKDAFNEPIKEPNY